MTPHKYPPMEDSDPDIVAADERYKRKLAERQAFAAMIAAEIVKQTPPPAHVCQFPASVVERFSDPKFIDMLGDVVKAYAESQENKKIIKNAILAKIADKATDVSIAVLIVGGLAWAKQHFSL